jgi:hypothetical protein
MSLEQLTLSDEQVQDIVASLITGGDGSDVVYDDSNDTLTVSLSDSISVNSLTAGDASVSNSPTNNTDVARKKEVDNAGKTDAEVQEIALAADFVI